MNWVYITQISQIVISALIILVILIQSKGKGLFSAFTGSIGFYRSRRGLEKVIFILTIVLGLMLIINSLVITLLS
ncbi:preprotein translocase subunit SecG [candidate division WWE3 bacterium RIFCSPHIGHO2_12_FULL_38_15]|uniref:Protein-export membrane protein SecG n=1 Tax=candidate division WWE3 bacterium RIFCSPHIGHO2_02_FULL_38_14 TaxID=1802620 RepID=A0A1F4V9V7_UNCKA|nr:MAG: preprotein translocase subunit SecG [candidate division WWE3 bacterium RIFCSPHIGHO2_01_FULL_38_45]OGC49184.1 MAG: preprotein translocase subunit SecG [candidate division WWE3 bacterium RIFCSPHIGHO2_12_FULL_38_15]OGC52550.1 MAG: preprotein translocase subunit SecG [candidate division WWE3 bacterium RIFCSPLOWO2_01_FULL_37_24]OGC54041.1 MAG: preprotein translocase subunit SecG [candidate division WWE3 bacterium RIFCSPHIGHO2_02_FULL_38_14]HLB51444.1 preprotein translocase subunit SecG [Pate